MNKIFRLEYLEKYEKLLHIIKVLDCNYCILQDHLFKMTQILNITVFDGHNKVYRIYTKDTFNLAIRRLEEQNLIERFYMPLPNGTISKYYMICLKKGAVSFIENIDIEKMSAIRKPTSNVRYMKSLIKGELLLENMKSKYKENKDKIERMEFFDEHYKYSLNTLLMNANEIYKIYEYFYKNNVNPLGNSKSIEHLKNNCLNFTKGNKLILNKHNLLSLKTYRHIYIDKIEIENNVFQLTAYATNPSGTKSSEDYHRDLIETYLALVDIFDNINETDTKVNNNVKFNLTMTFIVNNENQREKLKTFLKSKEASSERKKHNLYNTKHSFNVKINSLSLLKEYGRFKDK